MGVADAIAGGLVGIYVLDKVTGKRKKVYRKQCSSSKPRRVLKHKKVATSHKTKKTKR